jgi:hypothetical protein
MTVLPWEPIKSAPDDGRAVLVWNGAAFTWAAYRRPSFHPDEDFDGKCWCEDRLPMVPPPTHWLDLTPPVASPGGDGEWTVTANCWRRGPEGSIACYTLSQRRWTRCFEHEGGDTISNEIAEAVAHDMVRQLAAQIYPKVLYAVRSAQGDDPDEKPDRQAQDA